MGALFGKQKKVTSRISEQDKAVLQLKQQRDKLKHYQKRLESSVDKNLELAKKLLAEKKRDKAKLVLKKKRYQEQLLSNAETQLDGLEKLTHDLEFAQIELQVVEGLKVGNVALKKANEILSIENIEQIMEESREGIEKQREIEEIISGALTEEDNLAVEQELLDIIGETPALPEVPEEELPEDLPEAEEPIKTKSKRPVVERVALEA